MKLEEETFTRLSSSLRIRNAEESLKIAASIALSRGISRVVDTTRLDRIGIPVYSSIRPNAAQGSLCVHAGKGFTHAEAKIGAYMEAIEFSFAAPGKNVTKFSLTKPSEILKSFRKEIHFADFCPRRDRMIQHEDDIAVVDGEEIMSGINSVLVPAELVYHPFSENPGKKLYGTTTNGLASGNSLEEATVHGMAEVMERHIRSFDVVNDNSVLVCIDSAPEKVKAMAHQIEQAGFICHLRYTKNSFGMAYFSGYVLEPDEYNPISVAVGFGFHPIAEIAAVRALAEAVQGRLSHIHGGRDDIAERVKIGADWGRQRELTYIRKLRNLASNSVGLINFQEVPTSQINSIKDAQQQMFDALKKANFNHVVRVQLTDKNYPFQVVRVIIPGCEMYDHNIPRVGPRLVAHIKKCREMQNG